MKKRIRQIVSVMGVLAMSAAAVFKMPLSAKADWNPPPELVKATGFVEISESIPEELRSDYLPAIGDGVTTPPPHRKGVNKTVWSNYNAAQNGIKDATLTFTLQDPLKDSSGAKLNYMTETPEVPYYSQVTLFYYVDSHSAALPADVKIRLQHTPDAPIHEADLTDYGVYGYGAYGSPEKIADCIYARTFYFSAPTPVYRLFLDIEAAGGRHPVSGKEYCVALTEVELGIERHYTGMISGYGDPYEEYAMVKVSRVDSQDLSHGGIFANAFDGDPSTIWHTDWAGAPDIYSRTVYLELSAPYSLNGNLPVLSQVRYLPRQGSGNGSNNGRIKEYRISVSRDGEEYIEVASGTWKDDGEWKVADFPSVYVRYVRIEGVSTYGSRQDMHMSAGEIRFVCGH